MVIYLFLDTMKTKHPPIPPTLTEHNRLKYLSLTNRSLQNSHPTTKYSYINNKPFMKFLKKTINQKKFLTKKSSTLH